TRPQGCSPFTVPTRPPSRPLAAASRIFTLPLLHQRRTCSKRSSTNTRARFAFSPVLLLRRGFHASPRPRTRRYASKPGSSNPPPRTPRRTKSHGCETKRQLGQWRTCFARPRSRAHPPFTHL